MQGWCGESLRWGGGGQCDGMECCCWACRHLQVSRIGDGRCGPTLIPICLSIPVHFTIPVQTSEPRRWTRVCPKNPGLACPHMLCYETRASRYFKMSQWGAKCGNPIVIHLPPPSPCDRATYLV